MSRLVLFLAFLLTYQLFASPAYAQQVDDGDPCSSAQNGHYMLSGGPDMGGAGHLLSCDGAVWRAVLGFATDGFLRPGYVNTANCNEGSALLYDAATGGMRCEEAQVAVCPPEDLEWTIETPANGNDYRGVAYGNGLFAAASWNGTHNIMTSPDGIDWEEHDVGSTGLFAITYDNGRFVALQAFNNGRRVVISEDGVDWVGYNNALPTGGDWNSVIYGHAGFVAADGNATSRVAISDDGVDWTSVNVEPDVPGGRWVKLAYGNGRYAVTRGWFFNGGAPSVMTSADGVSWTAQPGTTLPNCGGVNLAYGAAGGFVSSGCWAGRQVQSLDGITWTNGNFTGVTPEFATMAYGEGIGYVGVTETHIYYSADGSHWARRTVPAGWTSIYDSNSVAYGNGVFVAVTSGVVLRGACPA